MARVTSLEGGGEGGGFGSGSEVGVPAGEGDVLGGDGSVAGFLGEVEAGRVVEFHVGTLEVLAVEGEEGALGDEGGGGVDVVGNADVREVLAQGKGLGGDGGGVGQEREGFDGLPASLIGALTKCFPVEPYPFVEFETGDEGDVNGARFSNLGNSGDEGWLEADGARYDARVEENGWFYFSGQSLILLSCWGVRRFPISISCSMPER